MPQQGIFIEGTESCLFQEFSIQPDADIFQLKKSLIKIFEMNSDQVYIVIGFGKEGFAKLGVNAPDGLVDFNELNGVNNLKMPSSQSEIFIWAHSFSKSKIVDFSIKSKSLLTPFLNIDVIQEGFRYHDSRDLTGFVDGSANPKGNERQHEVLIPIGQPNENGSYVITQKWRHNLELFHKNTVEAQEKIIGRTKQDSIELEGDAMPKNSHVSRVDLKVNGEAMKIYRRSYPYANDTSNGLFFLGFSRNIERIDFLLKSMIGATEDKISDRLMEFSTPLTGSYYFIPSTAELGGILSS